VEDERAVAIAGDGSGHAAVLAGDLANDLFAGRSVGIAVVVGETLSRGDAFGRAADGLVGAGLCLIRVTDGPSPAGREHLFSVGQGSGKPAAFPVTCEFH